METILIGWISFVAIMIIVTFIEAIKHGIRKDRFWNNK